MQESEKNITKVYSCFKFETKFVIPFSIFSVKDYKKSIFKKSKIKEFLDKIKLLKHNGKPIWIENKINFDNGDSPEYKRFLLTPVQELLFDSGENGFIILKTNSELMNDLFQDRSLNIISSQKANPRLELKLLENEYKFSAELILCYTGICFVAFDIQSVKELPIDTILNLNYFIPKTEEQDYVELVFLKNNEVMEKKDDIINGISLLLTEHNLNKKMTNQIFIELKKLSSFREKEKVEQLTSMFNNIFKSPITDEILNKLLEIHKFMDINEDIILFNDNSTRFEKWCNNNNIDFSKSKMLTKLLLGDMQQYISSKNSINRLYDRPIVYSCAVVNKEKEIPHRSNRIGLPFDPYHRFLRGFSALLSHKSVDSPEESGLTIISIDKESQISLQKDFVCFWLDGWNEFLKSVFPYRVMRGYFMIFILVLSQFFTFSFLSFFHQKTRKEKKFKDIQQFLSLLKRYKTELVFEVTSLNVNLDRFYQGLLANYNIKELLDRLETNLLADDSDIKQQQASVLNGVLAVLTFVFGPLGIISQVVSYLCDWSNPITSFISWVLTGTSVVLGIVMFIGYLINKNKLQ